MVATGCGDDDGGTIDGGADAATDGAIADGGAGAGGRPGSRAGSGAGGRPAIPPASYEGCSALEPVYAGTACTSACTAVRCSCDRFPASYLGCHPERGCLTALDCDVACDRDLEDVVGCIGDYAPCDSDADCDDGQRCLQESGAPGDCVSGMTGESCLDDDDCVQGSCVATASNGDRMCQDGKANAKCNDTRDCASGLACILPAASFVGTCSDGATGSSCMAASDCDGEILRTHHRLQWVARRVRRWRGRLAVHGRRRLSEQDLRQELGQREPGHLQRRQFGQRVLGRQPVLRSSSRARAATSAATARRARWVSRAPRTTTATARCAPRIRPRASARRAKSARLAPITGSARRGIACAPSARTGRTTCAAMAPRVRRATTRTTAIARRRAARKTRPAQDGPAAKAGSGDRCSKPTHCVASECALGSDGDGTCTDGAPGSACTSNAQCDSERCALSSSSSGGSGTCTDGAHGSLCRQDANCMSNRCAISSGSSSGTCTDGAVGVALQ